MAILGTAVVAASPAWSAPTCPVGSPGPGAALTGTPWPQLRYDLARLTPVADGHGVTVAVVDSGVDARHPQLAGAVVPGVDLLDGGDGRTDCVGHGTAVASIIAGRGVPAADRSPAAALFRGLAPGATILPVRVSEQTADGGSGTGRTVSPDAFAAAIRWAVDRGASVVNLSLVLHRDVPAVRAAVDYAVRHDVVLVAAVGNEHDRGDPVPYPAAYPGVVGVGAITSTGARLSASQVGPYVDLVAPGEAVPAAARVRGFARYTGTSFAAPFVAATAALIRQYRPGLSAAQVARRLTATADPAPGGSSDGYGAGVLNPYRAVTEALDLSSPASGVAAPPPAPRAAPAPSHQRALTLAGAGVTLALVVLVMGLVLPAGAARRWRPGKLGNHAT
ncbi:MAG TPA: type VII secretion-associated serine protease mycosin [Micromonosporaceae bacterium]